MYFCRGYNNTPIYPNGPRGRPNGSRQVCDGYNASVGSVGSVWRLRSPKTRNGVNRRKLFFQRALKCYRNPGCQVKTDYRVSPFSGARHRLRVTRDKPWFHRRRFAQVPESPTAPVAGDVDGPLGVGKHNIILLFRRRPSRGFTVMVSQTFYKKIFYS